MLLLMLFLGRARKNVANMQTFAGEAQSWDRLLVQLRCTMYIPRVTLHDI